MNFLAVYWGYCPEAPRRASAPQTIRMLFCPPANTQSHPRPGWWRCPPPLLLFLLPARLARASTSLHPGPGTDVWHREGSEGGGEGWALESYLRGAALSLAFARSPATSLSCRGLSFLIGRGEAHTLAIRDFVGDTWGILWKSKGELVAEGAQFSPLPSSLPAGGHGPLAGTRPRPSTLGERSPEEPRGSPPGCPAHSVSVAVSDDFNLQSRRILNLHKIKNYIIYVSGNGERSGASSDPALWEEHQNN